MEFKVNDKIIGFHYGVNKNSYFAGTISEISNGIITIIPLSCGTPIFINPVVDPIIEFDQEIYDYVCLHQSKANNLRLRQEFEELCIIRALAKQPITKTFEEYYNNIGNNHVRTRTIIR